LDKSPTCKGDDFIGERKKKRIAEHLRSVLGRGGERTHIGFARGKKYVNCQKGWELPKKNHLVSRETNKVGYSYGREGGEGLPYLLTGVSGGGVARDDILAMP